MKTINSKPLSNGKFRVMVELDVDEKLISIRNNSHYRLNYPLDDVVSSHVIEGCSQVMWCDIEQKWRG